LGGGGGGQDSKAKMRGANMAQVSWRERWDGMGWAAGLRGICIEQKQERAREVASEQRRDRMSAKGKGETYGV
jgi:hypothetical protein